MTTKKENPIEDEIRLYVEENFSALRTEMNNKEIAEHYIDAITEMCLEYEMRLIVRREVDVAISDVSQSVENIEESVNTILDFLKIKNPSNGSGLHSLFGEKV